MEKPGGLLVSAALIGEEARDDHKSREQESCGRTCRWGALFADPELPVEAEDATRRHVQVDRFLAFA